MPMSGLHLARLGRSARCCQHQMSTGSLERGTRWDRLLEERIQMPALTVTPCSDVRWRSGGRTSGSA